MKFVVYQDGTEVLVCAASEEKQTVKEWFKPGLGRSRTEYERGEMEPTAVVITLSNPSFRVRCG